jgi:hypothetical protein
MSEARPMQFPRLEETVKRPDWMETRSGPVRTLLAHIRCDEPEQSQQRAPNEPDFDPTQAYDNASSASQQDVQLDEKVMSRLPPPPAIGSLIPGARSAPPPANDTGQELLREHAQQFANAAIELAAARAAALAGLEGELLDLSIEIASAIIEREVTREPALHAALSRAALGSLGDATQVTLRTSPEAFNTIVASLGGEHTEVRGVRINVLADINIPGLGCVVDGDNVRIDATVSERLRAVRNAFEEERRKTADNFE